MFCCVWYLVRCLDGLSGFPLSEWVSEYVIAYVYLDGQWLKQGYICIYNNVYPYYILTQNQGYTLRILWKTTHKKQDRWVRKKVISHGHSDNILQQYSLYWKSWIFLFVCISIPNHPHTLNMIQRLNKKDFTSFCYLIYVCRYFWGGNFFAFISNPDPANEWFIRVICYIQIIFILLWHQMLRSFVMKLAEDIPFAFIISTLVWLAGILGRRRGLLRLVSSTRHWICSPGWTKFV